RIPVPATAVATPMPSTPSTTCHVAAVEISAEDESCPCCCTLAYGALASHYLLQSQLNATSIPLREQGNGYESWLRA
ncbi:MAG: hypothetical protein O2788_01910, partial [Chloroflexi bacterium]|nr:hypothetical protein [Chloroflexota bacterium]